MDVEGNEAAAAEIATALGAESGASSDVVNTEVAEAAEASDDAWLRENLPPDPDEIAEGAHDDPPAGGRAPADTTEQLETSEVDPAEYADALTAVMRAGLTIEDAKLLPPERVLALAEHQAKIQADLDRRFRESGSSGDATSNDGDPEGTPAVAEATPGSPPDFEKLASPPQELVDALALDGEGTKLLADWQKQAVAPLARQNQQLHTELSGLHQELIGMQAETARIQLQEQFPQLADTNTPEFGRVVERMKRLQSSGQYSNVRQLMEDSASVEFAGDLKDQASAAKDRIDRLKDGGQPTPPSGKDHHDERRAAPGDIDDQMLIALEEGNDAEVQRLKRLQGL